MIEEFFVALLGPTLALYAGIYFFCLSIPLVFYFLMRILSDD